MNLARALLEIRVRQYSNPRAHARLPFARTAHQVGNVLILDAGKDEIKVMLRKMESNGDIISKWGDYRSKDGVRAYLSSREINGYVVDILGDGVKRKELSREEQERIEMHQKLHTAGPHLKAFLMDKLGLGSTGIERGRAWRDEMMKLGLGPYTTIGDWTNYKRM